MPPRRGALLAVLFWGLSFVATKAAVSEVSPLALVFARAGLGYLFWYAALEKIEASRVAALLYLEPLVTLVAAALLLGERIQPVTVAGGALLLAGVFLVERAPAAAPPPAPASLPE